MLILDAGGVSANRHVCPNAGVVGRPGPPGAAVGRVIYDEPVIGEAAHSGSDLPPRTSTGRGSLAPRPTVSVFAACCKRIV